MKKQLSMALLAGLLTVGCSNRDDANSTVKADALATDAVGTADASQQTFNAPLYLGSKIDGCVFSPHFQDAPTYDDCKAPARQLIADAFCKEVGYVSSPRWAASYHGDGGSVPNWRYTQSIINTGTRVFLSDWYFASSNGSNYFDSITCAK